MGRKAAEPENNVAQFEAALKELEQLVARLEGGDLPLDESVKLFERGVQLTKQCRQSLETAELKVRQLTDDDADKGGAEAAT